MSKAKNIFFVGKGGVGKSTSAALNALFLVKKGFQVLLISLDPAHNQSDIFEKIFSDKPLKIAQNFLVTEVDQEFWIKQYLKDILNQINKTYAYLTAFNLDRYFKVIKHSPGLEEYALILAFNNIQRDYSHFDFLIFDMPPTALSLKFLSLPSLSLIWIEHLLTLRQEIIKKREIITKIKLIKKEVERDKILKKIKESKEEYLHLQKLFEDRDRTHIKLVLNPDKLSLSESIRILNALQDININLNQIICNKMQTASSRDDIDKAFVNIPILNFPHSETPLIGINSLNKYLETAPPFS